MAASYRLTIDGYKFAVLAYTGSYLEDGIVIPKDTTLDAGFLAALELAKKAYPYFLALATLEHQGYIEDEPDIKTVIKTIREGQALGLLEVDEHEEYLIDSILHPEKYITPEPKKPERNKEKGYVYLISSTDGQYKIGKAKDLPKRIEALGVKLPFPIDLIHSICSDDYTQLEKDLHALFADKRGRGEWFKLSPNDVEYIRGL